MPFAFTQEGEASLSGILRSPVAVNVNIAIMRAFVAMRNYLISQQIIPVELAEFRSRLALVEHDVRENLEAVNDLSEDVQKDIDAIYVTIGALSVKLPQAQKPRQRIGFKK